MFRKKVKCRNCGFLALHGLQLPHKASWDMIKTAHELGLFASSECIQRGREHIADGTHTAPTTLICTRHVWDGSDFEDKPKGTIFEVLNSPRKCPYFFPYNPGYSPAEHRELQREAKTRTLLLIGMLSAAAIGAVAAIVGQFVAG